MAKAAHAEEDETLSSQLDLFEKTELPIAGHSLPCLCYHREEEHASETQ